MNGAPAASTAVWPWSFRGVIPRERGSVAGELAYVVGDVHGSYDLLTCLLRKIVEDAERRARRRRPILIFCGDYIDRGVDSAKVMEAVLWLRRRGAFDVRLLMGNHEQGLLLFLEDPESARRWVASGGAETFASYGAAAPEPEAEGRAFRLARDALLDRMPASHLRLLDELELMIILGDYAFVHAGVNPAAKLNAQKERDLLWIRRDFLDAAGPFEKVVVHGHTWIGPEPEVHEHRIAVDTGAYRTGVLTAARLEDGELEFMQASLVERQGA